MANFPSKPVPKTVDTVIIDDDAVFAWAIETHLSLAGFADVKTYYHPMQALQDFARGLRAARIITDFNMPGMNGAELLKRVAAIDRNVKGMVIARDPQAAKAVCGEFPVLDKCSDLRGPIIDFINSNPSRA